MYDQEMYEVRPELRLMPGSEISGPMPCTICPQAYDPCQDAKTRLCQLDRRWCNATCQAICQEVRTNQTIFTDPNDPVRQWANAGCPGAGATGDNMLLYVAAGGVALVALVAVLMVTTRRPRGLKGGG